MANAPTKMANSGNLATFEQTSETKPFNSMDSPKMAKSENMATFDISGGHLQGQPHTGAQPAQPEQVSNCGDERSTFTFPLEPTPEIDGGVGEAVENAVENVAEDALFTAPPETENVADDAEVIL